MWKSEKLFWTIRTALKCFKLTMTVRYLLCILTKEKKINHIHKMDYHVSHLFHCFFSSLTKWTLKYYFKFFARKFDYLSPTFFGYLTQLDYSRRTIFYFIFCSCNAKYCGYSLFELLVEHLVHSLVGNEGDDSLNFSLFSRPIYSTLIFG